MYFEHGNASSIGSERVSEFKRTRVLLFEI